MSAEFKIKSSVDLSTDEAKQKLNDLKDFEKKPIEIKVKISNTLGELSKLETALKKVLVNYQQIPVQIHLKV